MEEINIQDLKTPYKPIIIQTKFWNIFSQLNVNKFIEISIDRPDK